MILRLLLFSFTIIINISFPQDQLSVTFRYVETPEDNFVRVFVPGEMNNWGPNSSGFISPSAVSLMALDPGTDSFVKNYSLNIGQQYLYKIHFHYNNSGTNYSWIPDPLNALTTNDEWENSILNVTDPLFFQPVRHMDQNGMVDGLSVGMFTNGTIEEVVCLVGADTIDTQNALSADGVFFVSLDPPRSLYESYLIEAVVDGNSVTAYSQSAIEIESEPLPEGLVLGPNWINDQMTLAVYAPSQPVMQLIISPAGATGSNSDALVMKKATGLDDVWWLELDLPDGQYDYEYMLLDGTRIPDPLSRRLENNRTRIEIGSGGISTADDYQWLSGDYIRPDLDTLIIYEIHIDDYAAVGDGQGRFDHIIDKLDYIKSIGINAIELLPVTDFPGTHSWGYDPNLISAVESNYGTPEDFKLLVDQAHLRGIAVIMDIVWNHIRSSSPIWQIQPNYNLNPYIKLHNELNPNETEGSWGMLDWDHFNTHTVEYINQVNNIWLHEYRIDGFRYDATRMIGWNLSQPEYAIPAWTSAIAEQDPSIYQIAEHLPVDPWLVNNTALTSSWHDSFHDRLLDHIHGGNPNTLTLMNQVVRLYEYSNSGSYYQFPTQAVKYMISHDEQSFIQEMVVFNNYTLDQARARDKFYASILFTSQGIPMVFQGQEFGLQTGWNDDNGNGDYEEKLQYRPIDWSYLETANAQSHLDHYKKLIQFRKSNPAIYRGAFFDLWRYDPERVIVYGYKDEASGNQNDQVVVIANFSNFTRTVYNVPFLAAGTWYNVLDSNTTLTTDDGNYGVYTIPANTAHIYSNNIYSLGTVPEDENIISKEFRLNSVYPNPFNPSINLELFFENDNMVEISIFDLQGKKINSLHKGFLAKGEHRIIWDGTGFGGQNVSSGLYFISFRTESFVLSRKISLVR